MGVFVIFLLSVSLFCGLVTVNHPPHFPPPMSKPICVSAGVGGNLVAVQASRISTFLHMNGMPGENSEQAPRRCPSPCTTFFSPGNERGSGLLGTVRPWREGADSQ